MFRDNHCYPTFIKEPSRRLDIPGYVLFFFSLPFFLASYLVYSVTCTLWGGVLSIPPELL